MAEQDPAGIRLNKLLAAAGIASRRAADIMISRGRVTVDGEPVQGQGMRVDPEQNVVRVDGVRIELRQDVVHLALNKPCGVLSAMTDDRGRRTIADYLPDDRRLFHVGRLDADSEGLLLVTNDGEFAHRLTHPSYEVRKTYLVEVIAPLRRDLVRILRAGVDLEDGPARADEVRIVDTMRERALIEIVLHEGRNRIVRRMMAEIGHPVSRLVRTAIGPVQLGSQKAGAVRELTRDELGGLFELVGL
ncbi:MAG TPA: pseudouridine synthase [Mycobacteriales bacterium]|nr:pseudouridine synthase [Mycobacteriales bacterium]